MAHIGNRRHAKRGLPEAEAQPRAREDIQPRDCGESDRPDDAVVDETVCPVQRGEPRQLRHGVLPAPWLEHPQHGKVGEHREAQEELEVDQPMFRVPYLLHAQMEALAHRDAHHPGRHDHHDPGLPTETLEHGVVVCHRVQPKQEDQHYEHSPQHPLPFQHAGEEKLEERFGEPVGHVVLLATAAASQRRRGRSPGRPALAPCRRLTAGAGVAAQAAAEQVLEAGAVRQVGAARAGPRPALSEVLRGRARRRHLHDIAEEAPGHAGLAVVLRADATDDLPRQRRRQWNGRSCRELVYAEEDAHHWQEPEEVVEGGPSPAESGGQEAGFGPRLVAPGADDADLRAL
mmetsp:Transcript_166386/g.534460  ORF Transcript_166386/g.534460 Transcript_166386/m.534460 type:complete len:345 (+) Transcript_166386:161-1195(+)